MWLLRRYKELLGDQESFPSGTWTRLFEEYSQKYSSERLRYPTMQALRERRKGLQRVIDRREKRCKSEGGVGESNNIDNTEPSQPMSE